MRRVEPRLHARRQLGGIARRLGHLENIEAQIGAGHAEYPVGEVDVLRRDLQQMRGELRALVDDGASRLVERRARDRERARAAGKPCRRAVGVAHDHVDPVGIDAELVRDELLV